jgi:hypothetical protein
LTGSGIQGNALKNPVNALKPSNTVIARLDRAISLIRAGAEAPPLPDTVEPVGADPLCRP